MRKNQQLATKFILWLRSNVRFMLAKIIADLIDTRLQRPNKARNASYDYYCRLAAPDDQPLIR